MIPVHLRAPLGLICAAIGVIPYCTESKVLANSGLVGDLDANKTLSVNIANYVVQCSSLGPRSSM